MSRSVSGVRACTISAHLQEAHGSQVNADGTVVSFVRHVVWLCDGGLSCKKNDLVIIELCRTFFSPTLEKLRMVHRLPEMASPRSGRRQKTTAEIDAVRA